MNEQQRKQAIGLAVVGVVVAAVFYWQFFRGPAKPPAPPAPTTPPAAGSKPAADKGKAAPAAIVPTLDIDTLLTSVQEVGFDYRTERLSVSARNPMEPLLYGGSSRGGGEPGGDGETAGGGPGHGEKLMIARAMTVTGIVYDPNEPVAVIVYMADDQIVNEVVWPGYEFSVGISVDRISEDTVFLLVDDTVIEKKLKEQ